MSVNPNKAEAGLFEDIFFLGGGCITASGDNLLKLFMASLETIELLIILITRGWASLCTIIGGFQFLV